MGSGNITNVRIKWTAGIWPIGVQKPVDEHVRRGRGIVGGLQLEFEFFREWPVEERGIDFRR